MVRTEFYPWNFISSETRNKAKEFSCHHGSVVYYISHCLLWPGE